MIKNEKNINLGLKYLKQRINGFKQNNLNMVHDANEKLKNLKNKEYDKFVNDNIIQIEKAANKNDIAALYKFANNLANSKSNKFIKPTQDEHGNKLSTDNDIFDFFSRGLLNANKSLEEEKDYLNINQQDITIHNHPEPDESPDEFDELFQNHVREKQRSGSGRYFH